MNGACAASQRLAAASPGARKEIDRFSATFRNHSASGFSYTLANGTAPHNQRQVPLTLRFQSNRFDFTSELPADCNAGNRFYGGDVAEFLAKELTARGFRADFLDEDWGWFVFHARGSGHDFEIAIYNLAEHGEGGRPDVNEWGLWIRAYERGKTLGLIP